MNNDDLLKKIGGLIDRKLEPIKQKLDEQGKAIKSLKADTAILKADTAILKDGQAHTNTAIEMLDNKLDETKTELRREIKQRQKPQHAD